MDDFYLNLYCGDSLHAHVNNRAGDFVIDLPKVYRMDGDWECALTELTFEGETEDVMDRLYVCSDIVEESYVRNTFLPLLRSITVYDKTLEFSMPYYVRLRHRELRKLRMFIRGSDLQEYYFKIDRLYCTLHFRKKKWAL